MHTHHRHTTHLSQPARKLLLYLVPSTVAVRTCRHAGDHRQAAPVLTLTAQRTALGMLLPNEVHGTSDVRGPRPPFLGWWGCRGCAGFTIRNTAAWGAAVTSIAARSVHFLHNNYVAVVTRYNVITRGDDLTVIRYHHLCVTVRLRRGVKRNGVCIRDAVLINNR